MQTEAQMFKLERPEFEGVKKSMLVRSSDILRGHFQLVKNGGENNLHTDTGEDAFWLDCAPLKPWQMDRPADRV